jgi:hypothetical protein
VKSLDHKPDSWSSEVELECESEGGGEGVWLDDERDEREVEMGLARQGGRVEERMTKGRRRGSFIRELVGGRGKKETERRGWVVRARSNGVGE